MQFLNWDPLKSTLENRLWKMGEAFVGNIG